MTSSSSGPAPNAQGSELVAGGALMSAGSYPVRFVRTVTGAAPSRVSALSRWGATGVDLTTMATLEHLGGVLAQISCSFSTARHSHAFIAGDDGSISTTYYGAPDGMRHAK